MGPHEAVERIAHTSERTWEGTIYTLEDPRYPEYTGRQVLCKLAHGIYAWTWFTPLTARKFQVGDVVEAKAFTDCHGKQHEAEAGLVVEECTTVEGSAPHHRIKAVKPNSFAYVEGAERFFAPA